MQNGGPSLDSPDQDDALLYATPLNGFRDDWREDHSWMLQSPSQVSSTAFKRVSRAPRLVASVCITFPGIVDFVSGNSEWSCTWMGAEQEEQKKSSLG